MKKLFKSKTFVGALLSIALCVSLITGATFAIFTSEANVNIAVTSGTVKVTAEVTGLTLYSPTTLNADGSVAETENAATEETFKNGGTAAMNDGKLVVTKMTPGDKVTAELTVTNNSNVSVLYRYGYTLLAGDGTAYDADALMLFEGLNFDFDGKIAKTVTDNGANVTVAYKTAYAELPESKKITAVVELPGSAGDKYQDLSLTIAFVVEAVQANVDTTNVTEQITSVTFAGENLNEQLNDAEEGAIVAITEESTIDSTAKIGNGVTITGLGKDKSVLNIEKGKITAENVTIKDVTIKGKAPAGNDGALQVTGKNTTIDNVNFEGQGFNGDTKAISSSGEGFVIKNSKISGAFRGIIFWDNIGGNNLIENCTIDNVIYTFNINASTVKPGTTLTVKNSTLNGWTSYAGCMSHVTFDGCKLGKSNGYAYLVAYADSTFTDCTFNDGYQIGAGSTGKTLTFTNCKLADGTLVTAENFATVLGDVDNDMKNNTVIVDGVTVNWN